MTISWGSVLFFGRAVLRLGIKSEDGLVLGEERGILRKTSVVGVFVVFLAVLSVVLAVSAEAISAFSSINLTGALAAVFAAVVGFVWFKKNVK